MNNRFKFRLWSVKENQFVNPNILVIWDELGDLNPSYKPVKNYIIQQCTGLKDKNGNLVFEGDIVEIGFGDGVGVLYVQNELNLSLGGMK